MAQTALLAQPDGDKPKRLTLSFDHTPLVEVLAAFEAQANVDLVYGPSLVEGMWLTCSFTNTLPQQVLSAMLKDTGLGSQWTSPHRAVLAPQPETSLRFLKGQVNSAAGLVDHAQIWVLGSARVVRTDAQGQFILPRLPRRELKLKISAPGFMTSTLQVSTNPKVDFLDLVLYPKPVLAEQITVSDAPQSTRHGALAAQGDWLRPSDLLSQGSVSRDLFHGLAVVPGVATGISEGGISLRGSRPAENLMLLEGMKLYEMEHALGHFSAINPDAVGVITLFKGGYPAQYGDRLAGVLDISTKGGSGERQEIRAGVDRDLGHVTALLPLGSRGSVLLSARQSHNDATVASVSDRLFAATFNQEIENFSEDDEFQSQRKFRFEDQLLKFHFHGANHTVSITGFRSRDETDEQLGFMTSNPRENLFTRDGRWGNTGGSLQWRYLWRNNHQTSFLASRSEYESQFQIFEASLFDEETRTFQEEQRMRSTRLRETRFQLQHHMTFGSSQEVTVGFFAATIRQRLDEFFENFEFEEFGPSGETRLIREEGFPYQDLLKTRQTGGFLNYQFDVGTQWRWLLGARFGKNTASDNDFFEPRISLQWRPRDHWEFSGFWGKFHQFVLRSPDTINYFEGEPAWFLAERDEILPGRSEQAQVGVKYVSGLLTLAGEVYRKEQQGSLLRRFNPLRPEDDIIQTAETYEGVDVGLVQHLASWSFNGGYSYQRTRVREYISFEEAVNFPTSRDRPHSFQAGLSWYSNAWEASAQWKYVSGLPFDLPEVDEVETEEELEFTLFEPETRNRFRLPYHRQLDLRVSYGFRLFGGDVKLGLSLTNALDRENITHRFFIFEEDERELFPVDVMDFGRRFSLDLQFRY